MQVAPTSVEVTPHSPAGTVAQVVVLDAPIGKLDYRVPPSLAGDVSVGMAVRVSLRNKHVLGYVTALGDHAAHEDIRLKDLIEVDLERPQIPEELLRTVLFAADYYGCSPGEMLAAALPTGSRLAPVRYTLSPLGQKASLLAISTQEKTLAEVLRLGVRGMTARALSKRTQWKHGDVLKNLRTFRERGWLTGVQT